MSALLLTILLWALWCLLHSLLLTPRVKGLLCGNNPKTLALYRLCYNGFAILSLVPVVWYTLSRPATTLFEFQGPWLALQLLLIAYALVMFYLGARAYDIDYFLGLTQYREHRKGKPVPAPAFCRHGILARVRHPWYGAGIALLWGAGPITDINCGVKLLLTAYFFIGAHQEEQRLKKELGREYIDYCSRVPMLFPWKLKA